MKQQTDLCIFLPLEWFQFIIIIVQYSLYVHTIWVSTSKSFKCKGNDSSTMNIKPNSQINWFSSTVLLRGWLEGRLKEMFVDRESCAQYIYIRRVSSYGLCLLCLYHWSILVYGHLGRAKFTVWTFNVGPRPDKRFKFKELLRAYFLNINTV